MTTAVAHDRRRNGKSPARIPGRNLALLLAILLTLPLTPAAKAADPPPTLPATGEEYQVLDEMTVTGTLVTPTQTAGDLLHTGSRVTRAGLERGGPGAFSSVYRALDLLAGIDTEMMDGFGLSGKEVRIRGIRGRFSGMSLEGMPNYGIMPIGPRDHIYDLENFEGVDLYKGATPPSLNTGSGNRGGAIALNYRRPTEQPGAELRQQFGEERARRSFFRLDSGLLPRTGTALFLSASQTKLDKWKGCGDLGPRDHCTAGLSQPLGKNAKLEFFYNYNAFTRHDFRPLSYSEADAINDFYRADFNCARSGDPARDRNYYDYHRSHSRNQEYLAAFRLEPAGWGRFSLKPYFSYEKGKVLDGPADKAVRLERYGATSAWRGEVAGLQLSAGYWFESFDLKKYVRANAITPTGRIYKGWKYLTENHGNGAIHSPWLQAGRSFGPLTCQAGLKYFHYTEPASTAYFGKAAAGTPYDYNDALEHNLGVDRAMSLEEMKYDAWLPSLAAALHLSEKLEIYASYGRNYMRPYAYVPVAVIYSGHRQAFLRAGLTLQDIIDDWKMETSDNFDLGLRWRGDWFDLGPTLFYSRHHDILCQAFDARVGVNYQRNLGEATAWGAEIEMALYPCDNLVIFCNPSYTRMEFDDDLEQGGHRLEIAGNQFPDTPRLLLKTGFIYTLGNFSLMPTFKYVGRRYGDPENKERIPGRGTCDLDLRWHKKGFCGCREIEVGLTLSNLFNQKYVGAIVAQDDGSGSAYYAAPPFSATLSLKARF